MKHFPKCLPFDIATQQAQHGTVCLKCHCCLGSRSFEQQPEQKCILRVLNTFSIALMPNRAYYLWSTDIYCNSQTSSLIQNWSCDCNYCDSTTESFPHVHSNPFERNGWAVCLNLHVPPNRWHQWPSPFLTLITGSQLPLKIILKKKKFKNMDWVHYQGQR